MSKLDELEKRMNQTAQKKEGSTMMSFVLGILLIGIGIYLVFQCTTVSAGWYTWRVGGIGIPGGMTAVPLLIGIGMLFYNPKSMVSRIVTVLGAAIILITILLSVRIYFHTTSFFNYIMMFGSILAGIGLLLRSLFKR